MPFDGPALPGPDRSTGIATPRTRRCLDYFIVFGAQHMDHLVSEMVAYYHQERPHQAKDNDPLVPTPATREPKRSTRKKKERPPDIVPLTQIQCRVRLGGLLKHYYRKAA